MHGTMNIKLKYMSGSLPHGRK